MPWCPVCKNEYKEGYTHCNDCNVDLVPTLDDMPKPVMFGEKEEMEDMKELLSKKGIKDTLVVYDEKDKVHELCVKPEFAEEATQILKSYFEAEMQNEAAQAYSAEELLDEEGNLTEEAMAAAIEQVLEQALCEYDAMRAKEGVKLHDDIASRIANILHMVGIVEQESPKTVADYKARLEQKLLFLRIRSL